MKDSIPNGKLARTGVAGLAAAKVGVSELKHKMKRPFLSKAAQEKDKDLLDEKNAKVLFNALTQLRGTALKIAQMLGMEQGMLPESYEKELSRSFHKVPPLNRVVLRKAFIAALKRSPEQVFNQFDTEAFAAASLGQVHKATLDDGTKVAVKVQYPGIGTSIKSDMTIMRGVARGLPNTHLILQSLDEIEARLTEEVDYRIEADNTRWFKQNVTLEGINIPTVYDGLSTQHIITSEFVTGLHLDDWLATNPTQAQRNQTAQLLYDFFTYSFKTLKRLHADPNPGNFLFHENGTITLIDFGCIRKFSDRFSSEFPKCMRAYIEDDCEAVFKAYKGMGMIHAKPTEQFYQEVLRPFGQWVSLPYQSASFDFGKHSDYTQQGRPAILNMQKHMEVDCFAEEMIFQNRTWHGLYQIFEKMGAVVTLKGSF